ncbi:hypothetical protein EDB87DRAFT_481876 [Lactarius vividus]|nr:hypothetical protein EDB87DRAFT_481876 [Lactarius vividus]
MAPRKLSALCGTVPVLSCSITCTRAATGPRRAEILLKGGRYSRLNCQTAVSLPCEFEFPIQFFFYIRYFITTLPRSDNT